MDGAELLRSRNRFEETLPSGLRVTLRLPQIDRCIAAGGVPLPILQHVAKASETEGGIRDVSAEQLEAFTRFKDALICEAVVEIEGQPVELTPTDVREFQPDDYARIFQFAQREIPAPKVPISEPSQNSHPPTPVETSPA